MILIDSIVAIYNFHNFSDATSIKSKAFLLGTTYFNPTSAIHTHYGLQAFTIHHRKILSYAHTKYTLKFCFLLFPLQETLDLLHNAVSICQIYVMVKSEALRFMLLSSPFFHFERKPQVFNHCLLTTGFFFFFYSLRT